MRTEHTPTPTKSDFQSWVAHTMLPDSILNSPKPVAYITAGGRNEPGNRIVAAIFDVDGLSGSHTAQEIVTACNSYDALVDALAESERLLQTIRNGYPDIKLDTRVTKVCKANRAALKDAGVTL